MFCSDNGPWLCYGDHAGSACPLREGKGTSWDGGVREPTLMRWPGHVPAGRVCDAPLMTIDMLPTVAGLIGAKLPKHKIDGLDISDVILGKTDQVAARRAVLLLSPQRSRSVAQRQMEAGACPHLHVRSTAAPAAQTAIPFPTRN